MAVPGPRRDRVLVTCKLLPFGFASACYGCALHCTAVIPDRTGRAPLEGTAATPTRSRAVRIKAALRPWGTGTSVPVGSGTSEPAHRFTRLVEKRGIEPRRQRLQNVPGTVPVIPVNPVLCR